MAKRKSAFKGFPAIGREEMRLQTRIIEVRAEAHYFPRLTLVCEIEQPVTGPVCILDGWIQVNGMNGWRLAEGKLLYCLHPPGQHSAYRSKQHAEIVIPLSSNLLQQIERVRGGTDFTLWIRSRILVSFLKKKNGLDVLPPPVEMVLEDAQLGQLQYTIPQSNWLNHLRSLGWSELDAIEIQRNVLRTNPKLNRAYQLFESAQNCFRSGDWDGTLVDCRKCFEALIKESTGQNNMKQAPQAFRSLIVAPEKRMR